jgi:hypothetical protein
MGGGSGMVRGQPACAAVAVVARQPLQMYVVRFTVRCGCGMADGISGGDSGRAEPIEEEESDHLRDQVAEKELQEEIMVSQD